MSDVEGGGGGGGEAGGGGRKTEKSIHKRELVDFSESRKECVVTRFTLAVVMRISTKQSTAVCP